MAGYGFYMVVAVGWWGVRGGKLGWYEHVRLFSLVVAEAKVSLQEGYYRQASFWMLRTPNESNSIMSGCLLDTCSPLRRWIHTLNSCFIMR